ncbi:MAG: hypothetical protein ONB15_03940 [candidate division KSB1 bacterium]|nr:hypothetical protein [candidate division KSB1 bacterium]
MEVRIHKSAGLRNDLLLVIPRSEIEETLFHIASRDRFMALPGLLRHKGQQDPEELRRLGECKVPVEEHLRLLAERGSGLLDAEGRPKRRVVVIGSRNVGNNHGFIAWQKEETPRLFHVKGDPLNYSSYSCLVRHRDGGLAVRALRFKGEKVLEGDSEITEEISWCVYANWVLRDGRVVAIEEIIEQFYDIRHVLAFDGGQPLGQQIQAEVYEGYPARFRENALRALREKGVPRNRFLHNCLGLSDDSIFILQREGTPEEVAHWLKEAGAKDGVILDNGASVFCWTWWLYPKGGFLFTAPDFRPKASAVLAFILKGPARTNLPGGSVSYSVV